MHLPVFNFLWPPPNTHKHTRLQCIVSRRSIVAQFQLCQRQIQFQSCCVLHMTVSSQKHKALSAVSLHRVRGEDVGAGLCAASAVPLQAVVLSPALHKREDRVALFRHRQSLQREDNTSETIFIKEHTKPYWCSSVIDTMSLSLFQQPGRVWC